MDGRIEPTRSQSQTAMHRDDEEITFLRGRRSLSETSYEGILVGRIRRILEAPITLAKIQKAEELLKRIPPLEKKMDGSELGTSFSSYSFQTTDYYDLATKAINASRLALINQKFFSDKP